MHGPAAAIVLRILEGDHVRVVGHAHAHRSSRARHACPWQFLGVLPGLDGVRGEAQADEGFRVVVLQQAGLDVAAIEFHRHLDLIGAVADLADQRRTVGGRCARRGKDQRIAIARDAFAFVRAGLVKAPLRAEAFGLEAARQRKAGGTTLPTGGLAQRFRQVATHRAEPAVIGPLDGFQQGLPAQCAKAILVAVIDHPPVAGRAFQQRGVATRPPGSSALSVRTSGLRGQCSHGPCTERERAAMTMCPVAGPAVPPTAVTGYSQPSRHSSFGPSGAKVSVIQCSG